MLVNYADLITTDLTSRIIQRDINIYSNSNITEVRNFAFARASRLTSVFLPNCTLIGNYAFLACQSLRYAIFPNCISIGISAFQGCRSLRTIYFPVCTTIASSAFYSTDLRGATFPSCSIIYDGAFRDSYGLFALRLTGSSVAQLMAYNAFTNTPIQQGTGSIYVPASLVAEYQTHSVWSNFSSRFIGV